MTLTELRQLHDAASPAPWSLAESVDGWHIWTVRGAKGTRADAELTAAIRNALPALLDVAEAARVQEQARPEGAAVPSWAVVPWRRLVQALHALEQA